MGVVGPNRRTTSVEMPASAGVHGPGEITICVGASALDLVDPHLIASTHHGFFPQLADVAGEIVDERVAVIEDQDHLSLLSQHLAQMRVQQARLLHRALERHVAIGADEEDPSVTRSVAPGKGR